LVTRPSFKVTKHEIFGKFSSFSPDQATFAAHGNRVDGYLVCESHQRCQMVYFQTKKGLAMEDIGMFYGHLVYFTAVWYITYVAFGIYFVVIWYVFPVLVCCTEKNPATLMHCVCIVCMYVRKVFCSIVFCHHAESSLDQIP
jgi:hypothetical protein